MGWVLPDRADRKARISRLFDAILPADLARGFALATPEREAVTLWRLPGQAKAGLLETLGGLPRFGGALGAALGRGLRVSKAIAAHHPQDHFLYLHYAGVRPEHQGQGLGGAAIRAGLARAAAMSVPAYLETATPGNVGLYQSLGFRLISEWDVPGGGPHFWSMMT